MFLIQLGEILPGGVGSGLYGIIVFAILSVFVAGLMVGRTPEYLGKKIGAKEMKLAVLAILILPVAILGFTAIAASLDVGKAGPLNTGPHGYAEILYAFTSAAGNNGSAFAGLTANTPFYNVLLGLAMLLGRFAYIVPMMAIAGSIAREDQDAHRRRHVPDRQLAVRRPRHRRDLDHGRLAVLPLARARPHRGAFHDASRPPLSVTTPLALRQTS